MQQRRPVMLVILDGWGWREEAADNAIRQAKTPTFDRLWQSRPHGFLRTSGKDVGLPDGQMGNSEVGHLNIGAGRVVMQDLPRIGAAIASGEIARAPALIDLIAKLKASGGTCHLIGLVSPGGVHSHQDHAAALAKILADGRRAGAGSCVHRRPRYAAAIGGRRHQAPPSPRCRQRCKSPPSAAAISPWTATSAGTASRRPITRSSRPKAPRFPDAPRGRSPTPTPTNKFDEFVVPAVVGDYRGMKDGDGVLCFNFRADRVREILGAMLDPDFSGFAAPARGALRRRGRHDAIFATSSTSSCRRSFRRRRSHNILGEVVADAGRTQLRMAETEKYRARHLFSQRRPRGALSPAKTASWCRRRRSRPTICSPKCRRRS